MLNVVKPVAITAHQELTDSYALNAINAWLVTVKTNPATSTTTSLSTCKHMDAPAIKPMMV